MMSTFKQGMALAGLVVTALISNAHAARLQIVSGGTAVDVLAQSATVDGVAGAREVSGNLMDSSGPGTVLLSDLQSHGPVNQGGVSVEEAYSHLYVVDASSANTSVILDASYSWAASGAGQLDAFSLVQSLSVDGLTLRIVADAGETLGQAVDVRFHGLADALRAGSLDSHDLGLTLDVLRGNTSLASYQGLWTDEASASVQLGFSAAVGDDITLLLSAYQGVTLAASQALSGSTAIGGNLLLQGHFTVTAVPEPETWGLALAGLLIASVAARRRTR